MGSNETSAMPLVTVVTVTYNSSAYVRDAIESVLAQTYTNIEYIIGDDCSFDNTWEIIQEYKDPRIRAYRNEVNLKEYPNRNKAIEKATGKYLIFIDGDDVIFQHGVAYFVSQLEAFPSAAMAIQKNYMNNIVFPALLYPDEVARNHFFGRVDLLSSSFASNFFRLDILRSNLLRTDLKSGDDEVRLRIALQYPTLFIQGWVSWPRETPGQASAKIVRMDGLLESLLYSSEIFKTLSTTVFNSDLLVDMESTLKKKIIRQASYFFLRLKWIAGIRLIKKLNLSLKEIFRHYLYRSKFGDDLDGYSPGNPMKRGFLNKRG